MDDTIFANYQRYDFHQVIWFKNIGGDASYFLDFNEYTLKNNEIILVFPGQIDKLDPEGKDGYVYAIHNEVFFEINQRLDSDYLNGYFSNAFVQLDNETTNKLSKLHDLISVEYGSENRLTLMRTYMEAFLFHIFSIFEKTNLQGKTKTDSIIPRLMRLIDTNFIAERETDFYANKLGMTPKTINEVCKKGTGKTVKQHLQERLILEIKKEIKMGQKNMKEIAYDLGFNEPAYFTRFFKQHTSFTPSEFRDEPFVQVKGGKL